MYLLKLIFLIFCVNLINGQCVVNRNLLGTSIPLLVDPRSAKPIRLQYNKHVPQFVFNKNDPIMVVCSNSFVYLNSVNSTFGDIRISCNSGTMFTYGTNSYDLRHITCSARSGPFLPSFQVGNCLGGHKLITVGFNPKHTMVPTFHTCYDDTIHQVLYTDYKLRPDYREGFFNVRPPWFGMQLGGIIINAVMFNSYYLKNGYTRTLIGILGRTNGTYVSGQGIDRGHNVPFGDFLYGIQRESTMGFMNVAPQWNKINTGSWNNLEQNVRDYCYNNARNLNVITGTWGILELTDDSNVLRKLFLGPKNTVPIPKLYWKAVHDHISNSGKVFISVNNPFEKVLTPLCTNICPKAPHKSGDGFIYCCSVSDFISRPEFRHLSAAILFRPANLININP